MEYAEAEIKQAKRIIASISGKKGGPARAKKLSPERRTEIAKMGASVRWGKKLKV